MKIYTLAVLALSFGLISGTSAQLCQGIAEENDLYIGVDSQKTGGVTEEIFNAVLDRIEEIYTPIIEASGATFNIEREWINGTVNAYASRAGNQWTITMFGGLARHEITTPLSFAAVACHEVGHHLGLAPKKASWWASSEGQSDYFAMLKCLRVFAEGLSADQKELFSMNDYDLDSLAQNLCNEQFNSNAEREICYWGSHAGDHLAHLLAELGGEMKPAFDTPSQEVVPNTVTYHPHAQCRLDTYFHGALCTEPVDSQLDDTDPNKGTCNRAKGDTQGIRPLCWFKPPV